MEIYLIEDNSLKANMIVDFLNENVSPSQIYVFESFQSGLQAILNGNPDLILLDMTLPTFDREVGKSEGRLRSLGGYDLLRKLKLKNIQFFAIVVTQLETFGEGDDRVTFDEITNRCHDEFQQNFIGSVHFSQSNDGWKSDIIGLIDNFSSGT